MRTKKQNDHRIASQRETAYLLKSKANRDALKHSIAQLGRQEHRLTPADFEQSCKNKQ